MHTHYLKSLDIRQGVCIVSFDATFAISNVKNGYHEIENRGIHFYIKTVKIYDIMKTAYKE